jgi:uncharacterized protein (TIGR02217 family)
MSVTGYHNEPLPLSLERVLSSPQGDTTIIRLGTGLSANEVRIANLSDGRIMLDAVPGIRSLTDLQALISFQRRRNYCLFSFPARDPLDYTVARGTEGTFATGDGTAGPFQLSKTYADSSNADVRRISKPEQGSVKIYGGGVLKTEGVDYTLDYLAGKVTFLSGHFPAVAALIEWEGRFFVPVRFAEDKIPVNEFFINYKWDAASSQNLVDKAAGEISPILLIEDLGA